MEIIIYEVLLTLRESLLALIQLSTPTSTLFTVARTLLMSLSDAKTVVSSTKWTKRFWFEDLYISLIYKRKSAGPNTEPCATSNVMFDVEELQFLIEKYCFLLLYTIQTSAAYLWCDYEEAGNQCFPTVMELGDSPHLINMLWLTVLNALEKSRYTAMVLCLLSNDE